MNLLEIEKQISAAMLEEKQLKEEYKQRMNVIEACKTDLTKLKDMCMNGVSVDKVLNAKRFIKYNGAENIGCGDTIYCIKKAIADLCNKNYRIIEEYYGCKDYASFICQYEPHRYGYGPKWGYTVFSIGATEAWRDGDINPTDDDLSDILYVLNCMLDKNKRKSL